jgi:hypothetical protein
MPDEDFTVRKAGLKSRKARVGFVANEQLLQSMFVEVAA